MAKVIDSRRNEILEVLFEYSTSHKGNSPSLRDLLAELQKRGYKIGYGTLNYHLAYLEGQKILERRDGKLIVVNSEWIPPD